MERVKVDLKNCYGIKALSREFDFTKGPAYALYAPNGVMKSSLAHTFSDAAQEQDSQDRIFPTRKTSRKIIDEAGKPVEGERVLVVFPYDDQFGPTEKTATCWSIKSFVKNSKSCLPPQIRRRPRCSMPFESRPTQRPTSSRRFPPRLRTTTISRWHLSGYSAN